MKNLAMETGVKVDTAMYFARVITFKFASNGIGVSFFRQFKNNA
ncbi:RAxF-45 family protein [Solibacillus silvestris]